MENAVNTNLCDEQIFTIQTCGFVFVSNYNTSVINTFPAERFVEGKKILL